MKALSKKSARVLDRLTRGLAVGDARRIDNAPGAYMALSVDRLLDTPLGPTFALAHYYEQNGDLVPDPDVTFLRGQDGRWYPMSFQNGLTYRRAAEVHPDGALAVDHAQQRDLAAFSELWMRNLAEQQGLGGRP